MPDVIPIRKIPDDPMLARLITAIGKEHAGEAERTWFEDWFRAHRRDVEARLPGFEADVERHKLLRKFLDNAAERHQLRELIAPFRSELARIRRIKLNATNLSAEDQHVLVALGDPVVIARFEQNEVEDIKVLLDISDDYRKGPIRKLVLEPFLMMLQNEDIEPSRERPLTVMVDALFGYLAIDPKRCPAGLRVIVSDVKRDFEKRPAQHPSG